MNFIDAFDFLKYFKREGDSKRAKIGHVNEVIDAHNTLTDATFLKEFILTQNNSGNIMTSTIQDGLIGGKKHYANADGLSIKYNDIDQQWVFYEGGTLMAFVSSVSDTPDSGYYDLVGGGQMYLYNKVFNQTSQEFIEDQKGYNFYLSTLQSLDTEFNLTYQELYDLADAPYQLLPNLNFGQGYIIDKIILQGVYATTTFAAGSNFIIRVNGDFVVLANAPVTLVTSAFNTIWTISSFNQDAVYHSNRGIELKMVDNLTSGDGALNVKVYYKIINTAL